MFIVDDWPCVLLLDGIVYIFCLALCIFVGLLCVFLFVDRVYCCSLMCVLLFIGLCVVVG